MAGLLPVRSDRRKFRWGTPEEAEDLMVRLNKLPLHPWRITIHTLNPPPNGTDLKLAEKFNVASNSLAFNYGALEEAVLPDD